MVAVTFTNKIEVANLALNLVGANEIQSFDDEIREAQIMKSNYELWVQQCLEKYPWRFAVDAKICSKLARCPIPQFAYGYELPADLIAIVAVYVNRVTNVGGTVVNSMAGGLPYKQYKLFSNNTLCTDIKDGIWVHYKKRVEEVTWPSSFISYVAYFIAIQLCPLIGRQFDLQKQLIALTYGAGSNSIYQSACEADAGQYATELLGTDLLQASREEF